MGGNKRRDLSVAEKLAILEAYDLLPQMSQREASIRLGLSQPLLCRLLRTRYDTECASIDVNQHRKRRRSGKDGEVEAALKSWYWEQIQQGAPGRLTGDMLKRKAEEIAKSMGKAGFVATNGWFQRWRKRENISTGRSHVDQPLAFFDFEERTPQTSQQQQQPSRLPSPPNPQNIKTYEDSAAPIKQEPATTDKDEDNPNHQPNLPTNLATPPTADEMLRSLDVLRRGIMHYDNTKIQIHNTYQASIENLLESIKPRNNDI